jgi:hypothetical protein
MSLPLVPVAAKQVRCSGKKDAKVKYLQLCIDEDKNHHLRVIDGQSHQCECTKFCLDSLNLGEFLELIDEFDISDLEQLQLDELCNYWLSVQPQGNIVLELQTTDDKTVYLKKDELTNHFITVIDNKTHTREVDELFCDDRLTVSSLLEMISKLDVELNQQQTDKLIDYWRSISQRRHD